ncbi:MAG: GNAT family N-acetyltransferase [Muribaculaceae bacterium]|nr:GNAT family N-acetyltransferase [Muribaculaceae bacterium]
MKTDGDFTIIEADINKRQYLPLLLTGDESESMIDRYLDSGTLYVGLFNGKPIAVCVAVNLDIDTVEIKNLAVEADFRRQGYGRRMLEYAESQHANKKIVLGTGETPSTLRFYKSCGYSYSHRIPNFFTDNYPNPIIEEGITLRDMVYLVKQLHHKDPLR